MKPSFLCSMCFLSLTLFLTCAHASTHTENTARPAESVDALLTRIQNKAEKTKTYQAAMRYDQVQGLLGDRQIRFGAIYYRAGPPVQFCVHFQRVVIDGKLKKQSRRWIFDGTWLVERLDDQKQLFKRQVRPPTTQPAGKASPAAMERSPFPIPLKPNKDRLLARFTVTQMPTTPKDPANSYHLKLIPRADTGIEFSRIDIWYNQKTLMPLKCHTFKEESGDEQIYQFFKATINQPLDQKYMDTSIPAEPVWQVEITPWKKNKHSLTRQTD